MGAKSYLNKIEGGAMPAGVAITKFWYAYEYWYVSVLGEIRILFNC